MIVDKNSLKEYLKADNPWYQEKTAKAKIIGAFVDYPGREIKKYLYYLRKQEYYMNTANGDFLKGKLCLFYERKKNKLGNRLGIEIGPNCFKKGLHIEHIGTIIVNPKVRAGENCILHGNNCIGNNGTVDLAPVLGNNVDIGFGAVVFGNISIADDVVIGSNAVVNKTFAEKGFFIAGVPAKIIKK